MGAQVILTVDTPIDLSQSLRLAIESALLNKFKKLVGRLAISLSRRLEKELKSCLP